MAVRNPLVVIDGVLQELPAGDAVAGDLLLAARDSVDLPAAGHARLFGRSLAGRVLPASVGPFGLATALQPSMWRQKVAIWNPPGNAATVPGVFGFVAPTGVGTATARTVTTANRMSRTRRLGYVSAATAGSFAGHYGAQRQWTTGDGAGLGGFFYACRFAFSDPAAVAGARAFVGMNNTASAPTNVEQDIVGNQIGVCQLSTDATQLYFICGGSAVQPLIPLGPNFPPMEGTGITGGTVYELCLYAPPELNGVVYWRVERVGTPHVAEGVIEPATPGVQTPLSSIMLTHRAWRCNNAQALACGIDVISIYIETDN